MSATGDTLGEKLHEASIQDIEMSDSEIDRSLRSWKRIGNARIGFFADMGNGNPITFKCGNTELTINASGITGKGSAANFD